MFANAIVSEMDTHAVILKVVFSVILLPNLVGNSLVVFVILGSAAMKAPMNYVLLNLAASDLLVGVGMIPRLLLKDVISPPPGAAGDAVCKIATSGNVGWIGAISSILSLALIAIERYYAIVKPLCIHHRITKARLKTVLPIMWVAAAVFCSPYFFTSKFDEDGVKCIRNWPEAWVLPAYDVLWLVAVGVLPTTLMAALYARVMHFMWSDKSQPGDVTLQVIRRHRKNVTITMLVLSVIYAVCWLPELIFHVVSNAIAGGELLVDQWPHDVTVSLAVLNSSVNPIVYALRFEKFKREFKKIVCCSKIFRVGRFTVQRSHRGGQTVTLHAHAHVNRGLEQVTPL